MAGSFTPVFWHNWRFDEKCSATFFVWHKAAVGNKVISCERCAIDSGRALTTLARSQSELKTLNETAQGDHDHSQTFQSNGAHQGGPALQP
ncbi:hypothetical protein EJ066_09275 [Mesorhizobium sp. M9A.F.Ca.ET.002.03.1.2]|uniref:hypothetical protein n=1 Tax=Mesorhizobium sp. M9A.F.Ca.ET.002.03.1.2 TaxID=2493668 RepID=UPI000F7651B6|nr:hypothetical protein [Mesorhizobium sp. M9A.F.Ca.ET.002.03.1.2]AZN97461.1 hypothetical protein EJ066_09275 [Mesorhizobium sp. M9A.F.Ca.ET.002.03.1.2]